MIPDTPTEILDDALNSLREVIGCYQELFEHEWTPPQRVDLNRAQACVAEALRWTNYIKSIATRKAANLNAGVKSPEGDTAVPTAEPPA